MALVTDVMLTSSNMAGDFRKINLGAGASTSSAKLLFWSSSFMRVTFD